MLLQPAQATHQPNDACARNIGEPWRARNTTCRSFAFNNKCRDGSRCRNFHPMGTPDDPHCYLDASICRLFLRKSHCRHAGKEHRGDARPIEHCNHIHGYALSDPIGDELIGESNAITHETPPDFILHSSNSRKPNHWHNRLSNAREPKRTTRQIFAVRVPRKNKQTLRGLPTTGADSTHLATNYRAQRAPGRRRHHI